MLIDFHAHSKGISKCCQIEGDKMVEVVKEKGMDGIILTNHYDKSYVIDNDIIGLAKRYIDEYYYVKECGDKINIKVFFGIEVTMSKHDNLHMLVYGVKPEFILKYPDIYDYEIDKLSKIVHEENGILVQAHPYRKGVDKLLDLKYLDGIEANCHPLYDGSYLYRITTLAKLKNKIVTCGGDYHAVTHRVKCGVYIPNEIKDEIEIVNYLLNSKEILLHLQEPDSIQSYQYKFEK
jgi:histidinol phosphatase-like PHP family hydrolase